MLCESSQGALLVREATPETGMRGGTSSPPPRVIPATYRHNYQLRLPRTKSGDPCISVALNLGDNLTKVASCHECGVLTCTLYCHFEAASDVARTSWYWCC